MTPTTDTPSLHAIRERLIEDLDHVTRSPAVTWEASAACAATLQAVEETIASEQRRTPIPRPPQFAASAIADIAANAAIQERAMTGPDVDLRIRDAITAAVHAVMEPTP